MKRLDVRILIGLLLILGGVLALLQTMGYLHNVGDFFWGGVFLVAGAIFMYVFATGSRDWWAAIPGMTMLGVGGAILLPNPWDGMSVLGGIGLAFWLIYLRRRDQWWPIIPGGVMLTLALVAGASDLVKGVDGGGLFFLGLAITFALVATLGEMKWAWWPAGALAVLGMLISISAVGFANYIWAAALIVAGVFLILRFFRQPE
jgi:hypothetical protein